MRLILLPLLTACLLGLGQAQHCTVSCPPSATNPLIVPKAQSTYVYSLELKTLLTPRDSQTVTVKADAEVSTVGECEAALNLKNVVLEGVPNGAELAAELSAKPLSFGYSNGRLLGVCHAKGDEDWSTNVKKAVVSALQVQYQEEKSNVDEQDFSGRCPTDYHKMLSPDDSTTVLEKRKNLNLCDDRRVDLRQTPDQALGQLKELFRHHLHPMDSEVTCRYTIKDKVVSNVDCEERHTLVHRTHKPIHVSNVKMDLKETKDGVADNLADVESEPKKPYFTFEHNHKNPTESDAVEVLKKLCSELTEKPVSIDSSFTFQKLVNKLRYLSESETANVDEQTKGSLCSEEQHRLRELFLDAAAYAASDGSIKALVKAHESQELSLTRSTALFSVVAVKAAPNKETVQALLPLIQSEKTLRPLILGISVLTRRYCEKTNDCETNEGVKEARDAYLKRYSSATDDSEKTLLVRALENLNVNKNGVEEVNNLLNEVVNNNDADPMLRTAAVNALPTDPAYNDRYMELVMDENKPNEARIAALQKLAKNNALKDKLTKMFEVTAPCVKNYVLTYANNLKKSSNELRKKMVAEDLQLPDQPDNSFGITRNIAHEYGPVTFEYDVVYPRHDNVTRSVTARVTRASNDQLKEMAEVQLFQKGFDKELNNLMNFLKKRSLNSGVQFFKDFLQFVSKLRKDHDHSNHHLKLNVKVNGKNVIFTDVFDDLHKTVDLLRKRYEKVMEEKKVDRTVGGVLLDSKLALPTITGLPLLYKFGDNFVVQYNGELNHADNTDNLKVNLALVAGLHGGVKLKVKDNKMGYEYDGKLAYTPRLNVDRVKGDNSRLYRLNVQDLDQRTVMKFKQNLRERRATGEEKDYENEFESESKSDKCYSFFLLDYCRKATHIKGLLFPNVEYYIVKPEKEVTAIELELKREKEGEGDKKTHRYSATLTAVGSPTNRNAKAQLEVVKGEEYKVSLKTPEHEFNTQFTLAADKNNLKMNLHFPNVVHVDLTGVFEHDKENSVRKNKFNLEYQLGNDETKHTVDYDNEFSLRLKRSSKEKNTHVYYKSNYKSSHFPTLNHQTHFEFKYRPFKVNELNLQLDFGKEMEHKYQLMRNASMEVEEIKPFKLKGNSELRLMANDFDVDYDLKSDYKYESNKGTPIELQYKVKGKDRSKRAAEMGQEDVEGMIDYKNSGSPIDSKMNANLKVKGNQYGYESELKQVEPQKYEGKITLSKNDKKIFITHKDEMTKPTESFYVKSEGEVTYSDSDMKKEFSAHLKKENDVYMLNQVVKRNGELYFENELNVQKNGKLYWNYHRNDRYFKLDSDNVFNPTKATAMLKVKDREYNAKLHRHPFSYSELSVEGNDKAYVKKANLHMSLIDPTTLNVVTQNDGLVEVSLDLVHPNTKYASLKVDSKKYNLYHEGDMSVSFLSPRFTLKHYTKRGGDRELKVDADVTYKGSLVTFYHKTPEHTTNVKYSRHGGEVDMDIDSTLVEGSVKGTLKEGTIHLKGRQSDFEVESTYKCEDGKVNIVPVKSENGKLEGVLSRKVPSHLVLETPKVKLNMDYDRHSPTKKFKLDYDGINFEKHTNLEYEPSTRYDLDGSFKLKDNGKGYTISLHGVPKKALNLDMDVLDFKFKVNKPEDSNKAQFSYTFNDYTETEEYEFDPHRAYLVNWLSAVRKYVQNFVVDEQ